VLSQPKGGKQNPETRTEALQQAAFVPMSIFKVRATTIFRCVLGNNGGSECTVATATKFVMANGITASADRQTIFVVDPMASTLNVMARQADGSLVLSEVISTVHSLDNIEMHSDGQIDGGSGPLGFSSPVTCEAGLGDTKVGPRRPASELFPTQLFTHSSPESWAVRAGRQRQDRRVRHLSGWAAQDRPPRGRGEAVVRTPEPQRIPPRMLPCRQLASLAACPQ
jgi:hypothetical protein